MSINADQGYRGKIKQSSIKYSIILWERIEKEIEGEITLLCISIWMPGAISSNDLTFLLKVFNHRNDKNVLSTLNEFLTSLSKLKLKERQYAVDDLLFLPVCFWRIIDTLRYPWYKLVILIRSKKSFSPLISKRLHTCAHVYNFWR